MLKQVFSIKIFVIIASILAVLMMVLPPLALILHALQSQAWQHLPDSGIPTAIWLSLRTTFISALLIILLGTPLAYVLVRTKFPGQGIINVLVQIPIVLPPAVAGLALLITFGRRGLFGPALESLNISLPFTTAAVIIAQIFVAAPFFIRSAQIGFDSVPREIEDAARVDGTTGFSLFWHITLPLAWRSLAVGITLSWTRALGEFGATILFAGSLSGRTQTMPLLVYNVLERDLDAAIWTGLILIIIALVALAVMQLLSRQLNLQYDPHTDQVLSH